MTRATHWLIGATLGLLLGAGIALAQNSWQPFQTFKGNFLAYNGGSVAAYEYGYPGTRTEPDVAAQWIYDISSGNVTDKVGGLVGVASGSVTYGVDTSAYSSDMALGVTGAAAAYFEKSGVEASLDWGTSDATVEWVGSVPASTYYAHVWDFLSGGKGTRAYYDHIGDNVVIAAYSEDATSIVTQIGVGDLKDSVVRHFRITYDRDGNAEVFVNGVSKGTAAVSALDGKTIKCNNLRLMGRAGYATMGWNGTMVEQRFTTGNLTNDSWTSGDKYYGFPTYKNYEPNVAAQWLFDEASGSFVDEVSGLTCAARQTAATYNVTATGSWAGVSPGVTFDYSVNNNYYWNTGLTTELDTTTEDMTLEAVVKMAEWPVGEPLYIYGESPYGVTIYAAQQTSANYRWVVNFITDDATNVGFALLGMPAFTTDIIKVRVTLDRDGNAEVFVDGASMGSSSISAADGKAISPIRVVLGGAYATAEAFRGSIFEIRKSLNATNNSNL